LLCGAAWAEDPVARLDRRLAAGQARLEYKDDGWGYLSSLLSQLDINPDTQTLVFSKTSFQQELINPRSPRAIYFNDSVMLGAVRGGEVFELAGVDPARGVVFYSLDTKRSNAPRFEERDVCELCHNRDVFVATVYPGADGTPAFLGGNSLFHRTDHASPFHDRWGGWYVTGKHGSMTHLGNAVAHNPYRPLEVETEGTQNRTSLADKIDVSNYPVPTSDLIALMVLEHQTKAINLMTRLNREKPSGAKLDAAVEELAAYLTFADETALTDPIEGVSSFTRTFPQRGPRDSKGRSLRDFDLKTRMFRYPLSYMVYTELFDGLYPAAKEAVYRRLYEVLSGADTSGKYAKLAAADRAAALEILEETKSGLPEYWASPQR
jgi:hypothetical protein